jgi:DivIVA domain-containing protein
MSVDRDQIERRDFPSARRGYDTGAVDEHLRRVADACEELGRGAADRPATATLAQGTSEHVRAILEAAEAGARQLREDAGREAGDQVERVEQSANEMLGKLERLQSELDGLLSGLKSTAATLAGSLEQLRRDVGTLHAQTMPGVALEPQPGPGPEPEPEPEPDAGAGAAPNGARSGDEAGARLVALNMALEGASREDAGRYLAAHYELADAAALLDDVYTSAGR